PTSPKKLRFGTPRLRPIAFSDVTWMLHFIMPSMSDGRSPASSSASLDASSAVTSSERPMSLLKGSWPMPTIAALSLSDTRAVFSSRARSWLQEGAAENQARDREVDDEPGHVDERRDEGRAGTGGVEAEAAQHERQERPGERAERHHADQAARDGERHEP